MIDIPLYMFANLAVTDAVTHQRYEKGFSQLLRKSGGESGADESRNRVADTDYQPFWRLLPRH